MGNTKSILFLLAVFIGVALAWAIISTSVDLKPSKKEGKYITFSATQKLAVADVQKSSEFYSALLGWEAERSGVKKYTLLKSENERLVLIPATGPIRKQTLYFEIKNINREYPNLKIKFKVVDSLKTTDYGSREFSILDPDSNLIILSEDLF